MLPWANGVNTLLAHMYRHRHALSPHPSCTPVDIRRACIVSCGALVTLPAHYDAFHTHVTDVLALAGGTQQHTMHVLRALVWRTLTLALANEADVWAVQQAAAYATLFTISTVHAALVQQRMNGR